jgi:hypothetical protein
MDWRSGRGQWPQGAAEVLWLIIGTPEELEFLPGAKSKPDMSFIYPFDPTQLPKELAGVQWPPKS